MQQMRNPYACILYFWELDEITAQTCFSFAVHFFSCVLYLLECSSLISSLPATFPDVDCTSAFPTDRRSSLNTKAQKRKFLPTMPSVQLSVAIFFCLCVVWTTALPKRSTSNGVSSGAGEIPDELPPDYYPFDGPLGKGSPGNEVFNDYDLDSEGNPRVFPEYDVNEIPHGRPKEGDSERPFKPDDRIPEEKHPEDEPKKEPEEEEDHEPASHEKPKEDEETHDDEEEEVGTPGVEEEKPRGSEEEDTHAVEDEKKNHEDEEEETQEGEEEVPLPFKPALFSFQQVNHYIKQLEKAMDHVFKDALEEAALLNNTFANTTEEEVEVNGHKYKVQKSIIETGDEDKNSTLFVEAISSVKEDEPKNRKERSNPDAEPIQ